MPRQDAFSAYHPAVNFLYFALVLTCAAFLLHPVFLLISLAVSLCYAVELTGGRAVARRMVFLLPMMSMAAILNPLFQHSGVTILAYFPSGNPLTMESIVYGLAFAVMLAAVFHWFSCFSAVMTTDKFIYLFGRVIPALSLVLSMTLRFLPAFRRQLRLVSDGRRSLVQKTGQDTERLRDAAAMLSILVTWSLEHAIETAASMRGRGYGLPGRTAFSIYRLTRRDIGVLLWLGLCGGVLLVGWAAGGLDYQYIPVLRMAAAGPESPGLWLCYLALCLTPLYLNHMEDRQWKRIRSGD